MAKAISILADAAEVLVFAAAAAALLLAARAVL